MAYHNLDKKKTSCKRGGKFEHMERGHEYHHVPGVGYVQVPRTVRIPHRSHLPLARNLARRSRLERAQETTAVVIAPPRQPPLPFGLPTHVRMMIPYKVGPNGEYVAAPKESVPADENVAYAWRLTTPAVPGDRRSRNQYQPLERLHSVDVYHSIDHWEAVHMMPILLFAVETDGRMNRKQWLRFLSWEEFENACTIIQHGNEIGFVRKNPAEALYDANHGIVYWRSFAGIHAAPQPAQIPSQTAGTGASAARIGLSTSVLAMTGKGDSQEDDVIPVDDKNREKFESEWIEISNKFRRDPEDDWNNDYDLLWKDLQRGNSLDFNSAGGRRFKRKSKAAQREDFFRGINFWRLGPLQVSTLYGTGDDGYAVPNQAVTFMTTGQRDSIMTHEATDYGSVYIDERRREADKATGIAFWGTSELQKPMPEYGPVRPPTQEEEPSRPPLMEVPRARRGRGRGERRRGM